LFEEVVEQANSARPWDKPMCGQARNEQKFKEDGRMSVATEDVRSLKEMFGKAVEIRVENVSKQVREVAEAAYTKAYKECEAAGDSLLSSEEDEAEVKQEFTDQFIYYRGFRDGVRLSAHVLGECVKGVDDLE
jgi:sarcosine oxidase delta subunit